MLESAFSEIERLIDAQSQMQSVVRDNAKESSKLEKKISSVDEALEELVGTHDREHAEFTEKIEKLQSELEAAGSGNAATSKEVILLFLFCLKNLIFVYFVKFTCKIPSFYIHTQTNPPSPPKN